MITPPKDILITGETISGTAIYDEIKRLAVDELTSMLEKMIELADTFDGWVLSVQDGNRLIKILDSKTRIIKSSFKIKLNKSFTDFETRPKIRFNGNLANNWQPLNLVAVNENTEFQELDSIIAGYEKTYSNDYYLIIQRLQFCLQRSPISVTEIPLHVKRLYEAFQYSIDSINFETRFKVALYRLFASFVVSRLSPIYEKIDRYFIEHNILPELQSIESSPQDSDSMPEIGTVKIVASANKPLLIEQTPLESQASQVDFHTQAHEASVDHEKDSIQPAIIKQRKPHRASNSDGMKSLPVRGNNKAPNPHQISHQTIRAASMMETSLFDKVVQAQSIGAKSNQSQVTDDVDQASQLRRGDWVEIKQNNGSKMAKLVWKADDCSLLIFVDNTGNRVREIDGSQFNEELQSGSMTLITSSSVASRNTHLSILQQFKG